MTSSEDRTPTTLPPGTSDNTTAPSKSTLLATSSDLAHLSSLTEHAKDDDSPTIWAEVNRVLAQHFGHSLFTILTYSSSSTPDSSTLVVRRIYSTREDLHPLGLRRGPGQQQSDASSGGGGSLGKSEIPPQREAWIQRVLIDGETWRGSTKEDLKAVFEDWELLWSLGLGSVLNIPVRLGTKTIGSLNVLDKEHAYDEADLSFGTLVAQMVAGRVDKAGRLPIS
ncbi:uncharacterized protein PV06_09151 [Exophiala oligosperma]|uniref:GAF domain-containing protein n=1 Tax=Exophiala oligosperma TaxID=215243 RepID=A0A0D2DA87_9EURO|nr:uncharacterized protein PV06_09151 [Exophiala oligosperma]KIW39375.1 hypothetical protein PV06_09151 [Exophiala oligosperma]